MSLLFPPVAQLYTEQARRDRARLAADPHRPAYHFTAPANWLNDPNGLIQYGGLYHLFYQHNPHATVSATKHWGHAVSRDLVHWEDWPIALAPAPGTADQDGCFSGCIVVHNGVPTMIYTGVRVDETGRKRQRPCVAVSYDGMVTWERHAGNPVIPAPPTDVDIFAFRDHAVWREADGWYHLVGSGIRQVGGAALLYRSDDLVTWDYLHPLYVGDMHQLDPLFTGIMWECPDFFALGDRHVLVVSVFDHLRGDTGAAFPMIHHSVYFSGEYADHRLTPTYAGLMDYGRSWYAPQSFTDDQGRRIMFGWLREERAFEVQKAAGWSGAMSLPRVLTMRPNGRLGQAPAPEVECLRGAVHSWEGLTLSSGKPWVLDGAAGDTLELVAEVRPGEAERVGLLVRAAPDGSEQTRIVYDQALGQLTLDTSEASLDPATRRAARHAPLRLPQGEPLRLRVFVDRSIVEVFANDDVCITSRVYPTHPDSLVVALFAEGGLARLDSLTRWEMRGIWG